MAAFNHFLYYYLSIYRENYVCGKFQIYIYIYILKNNIIKTSFWQLFLQSDVAVD